MFLVCYLFVLFCKCNVSDRGESATLRVDSVLTMLKNNDTWEWIEHQISILIQTREIWEIRSFHLRLVDGVLFLEMSSFVKTVRVKIWGCLLAHWKPCISHYFQELFHHLAKQGSSYWMFCVFMFYLIKQIVLFSFPLILYTQLPHGW